MPRALGKHAHVQPVDVVRPVGLIRLALLPRDVLHAFADQRFGLGMQFQLHAKRLGRALAGVVVGRRADAAAGEHEVARSESALQRGGDALGRVADVLGPRQLQAARGQQLDELGHVLVGALAGQDFVADDHQADFKSLLRRVRLHHPPMLTAAGPAWEAAPREAVRRGSAPALPGNSGRTRARQMRTPGCRSRSPAAPGSRKPPRTRPRKPRRCWVRPRGSRVSTPIPSSQGRCLRKTSRRSSVLACSDSASKAITR